MKMKMENSSDRYDINRPWSRDKQSVLNIKRVSVLWSVRGE